MSVGTGIIDSLGTPPLGSLNAVLDDTGPFTAGSWSFNTFHTSGAFLLPAGTYQVHGTYGVIVVPNGAIPITWGYTIGFDSGGALGPEGTRYENRLCQVVPMHQILSGALVPIDIVDVFTVPQIITWPFRLIGGDQLGLFVAPGIAVDLYYLCVL